MFNEKPSAKPGTNGRWPKGKANRVPRVKVLNYLKKVALFFRFERDIHVVRHRLTLTLAEFPQHLKVRSAWPLGSSKNTVIAEFLFHKSVILIIVSRSNRKMPRYYFS